MVVKQLQFNEKVKISCTECTLLHKKNTPQREDHRKRSPILRPEKKARFLRKKSHKSGFCSFKEQIICLSFPYFSSRIVIIRFILAAKIVQAPCIFVA